MLRPTIQITLDCADPHALATFWSEALGYDIEDHTDVVRSLVEAGRLPESAVQRDGDRLCFADVAACRDPAGQRPRLLLQREATPKSTKNRLHLDVQVGAELVDQKVERLLEIGATRAWESADRGVRCVTLRDPEGNELCLTGTV